MRAVVTSLPLRGHTNPLLRLARALVERGEEVTCLSTPPFADATRATGARYLPYGSRHLADLSQLPSQTDRLSWLLMSATQDVLATDLAAIRTERPHYVITDSVAPWGHWLGQILQVPVVTSVTTFAFNRHVLALAAARGARPKSARQLWSKLRHIGKAALLARRLRSRYGVPGLGPVASVMSHSALNIVYTSRLFQPRAETFGDDYQFIGPGLDGSGSPDESSTPGVKLPPLVYISLGTLFNDHIDFYKACVGAFANQRLRILISTGDRVSHAALGTLPSNIELRAHVDQLAMLRRAAVFVTHGGMNSVSESVVAGVPLVVVPQMSEQQLVGGQVAALGAGLCLPSGAVSQATLLEAVFRVLQDDDFGRQARRLGESMRAAGGVSRGARAVLDFVSSGTGKPAHR